MISLSSGRGNKFGWRKTIFQLNDGCLSRSVSFEKPDPAATWADASGLNVRRLQNSG
jgi:hypothetical protein